MSSRWIRSSSTISPSWSTMMVLRGVAYCAFTAASSSLTMPWLRARELVELVLDLVAAERGQALEAQVEDRLGLLAREPRRAVLRHAVARIVDQLHQRRDRRGRPVARHQRLARRIRIGRRADQADD